MALSREAKAAIADKIDEVLADVRAECLRAATRYAAFNSAHEGYAVLREEVDELWDEIKADRGYEPDAMAEALQVAAMGVRYILDLGAIEWD